MPYNTAINNRFLNQPVTQTATSYTALLSDVIIEVTNTSAIRTITLPAPSSTGNVGKAYMIKDASGGAYANNIIVTPASGTLDGASSMVINANYGSLQVYCDGSNYYSSSSNVSSATVFALGSWSQYNSGSALSGQSTSDSAASSSVPFSSTSRFNFGPMTAYSSFGLTVNTNSITINQTGRYRIFFNIEAPVSNTSLQTQVVKNGITVIAWGYSFAAGFAIATAVAEVCLTLSSGDTLDFRWSNSGSTDLRGLITTIEQLPSSSLSQISAWNSISGTSQAMLQGNGYVPTNASQTTLTLPSLSAFGTIMQVAGVGSGGWKIAQNAGQNIVIGNQSTTVGTGGSISSTNQYDGITLLCTSANTQWVSTGAVGNLTVV